MDALAIVVPGNLGGQRIARQQQHGQGPPSSRCPYPAARGHTRRGNPAGGGPSATRDGFSGFSVPCGESLGMDKREGQSASRLGCARGRGRWGAPSSALRAPSPRRGEGDGDRSRRAGTARRRDRAVALAPRGEGRGEGAPRVRDATVKLENATPGNRYGIQRREILRCGESSGPSRPSACACPWHRLAWSDTVYNNAADFSPTSNPSGSGPMDISRRALRPIPRPSRRTPATGAPAASNTGTSRAEGSTRRRSSITRAAARSTSRRSPSRPIKRRSIPGRTINTATIASPPPRPGRTRSPRPSPASMSAATSRAPPMGPRPTSMCSTTESRSSGD